MASGTARPQSDGKIVVIGSVTSKVELEQLPKLIPVTGFALTRYDSNGSIDSSFGERGGVITDFSTFAPTATSTDMVIESNGDIIVAGQAAQPGSTAISNGPAAFTLVRYTPSGALDPAFGSAGKVITSFGQNITAGIAALAVDGEDRLVAAGISEECESAPRRCDPLRLLVIRL